MNFPTNPSLPKGWVVAVLDDCAEIQLGKMLDKLKRLRGRPLPYLRNANVRWGHVDLSDLLEMPFEEHELERYALRPGDVIVCEGGEPGRAAIWTLKSSDIKFQKALHRVRVRGGIYPNWLVQRLYFDSTRGTLGSAFTGTTIDHLPLVALRQYRLPIAPLTEQKRILAVVEAVLSKLDAAVAALERVRANLKRYRASVLKAAIEGRLVPTEAELVRKEGRDFEPASVLLDRILAERRRRWEEFELTRMKAAGKPHKNDEWKSKYKEPVALDTSTLPQLPDGWCWAPLDALASLVGGVTKGQRRKPTEELRQVPYLRVANVQRGYLDLSVVKEIEATEDEIKELRLESGDVLFNEGGDRDKLGRGWVWNGEIPECIHQNHVFRARMYTQDLLPKFLSWYGNSSAQLFFLQEGKQTTNLASLNSTNLKKLPVPLPPLAEQKRIAAEIELLLSVTDATVNTTDASIARCNRLRQSILKWAFEGKLVDQDPNDEPASALLERIRTERASAAPPRKPTKHETRQTEAAK